MVRMSTKTAQTSSEIQNGIKCHNSTGFSKLIAITVLVLAWITAFISRLFPVVRFESIIHEYDPWFNYRASAYFVEHGPYNFLNWFDEKAWYPLGRHVGNTVYPGMMVTSGIIHWILHALNIPVHIREICVFAGPVFSGMTALATYFLTAELWSEGAGLFAACFMAIVPGYTQRSVAGGYDNECMAIFALQLTFYLWVKSVKTGSIFWSVCTALSYFYMVSVWGGYVLVINLIPLHVFVLLLMGRFSLRLFVSYTVFYAVGLLLSIQVPFVNFKPLETSEHMAALGVFGLLIAVGALRYLCSLNPSGQSKLWPTFGGLAAAATIFAGVVLLTYLGVISPWSGRFYALWDTSRATSNIPLIKSVSEHQHTTWTSFFFDLHILVATFPAGLWYCIKNINDERVFVVLYALSTAYCAGLMVRLKLTVTPVLCMLSGIVFSILHDHVLRERDPTPEITITSDGDTLKPSKQSKSKTTRGKAAAPPDRGTSRNKPHFLTSEQTGNPSKSDHVGLGPFARFSVVSSFLILMLEFILHCNMVTRDYYSHPSVVYDTWHYGQRTMRDESREAYGWLSQNTAEDARVMSWWDYGYQITGLGNRTTVVDNNTWNNSHIALVGKAMASNESAAYDILTSLNVDYVLVFFGGALNQVDDISKFMWMVRIAQGEHPDDIREGDYYHNGHNRIDSEGSKTMLNCLLYKLCYYRFTSGGHPVGYDSKRRAVPGNLDFKLTYLEEAYTSVNWLIRIYRSKKK